MADIDVRLEMADESWKKYDKSWIKSIESTTQSTTNPSTIEYGILANTGRLEIKDLDGQIRSDIESGVFPISNVPVSVMVNNNRIQQHITNDSDYTEKDNLLILPLTNKISLYDNIPYEGMPLEERSMTAYELFDDVCNKVGIDIDNDVMISQDALNTLNAIVIKYPYIKPCTAREALNKICEIAQLQMFASNDDRLQIISTSLFDGVDVDDFYNVPSYYKITNLDRTIVLKNKYDAIEMKETKVYPKKDISVSVYSWNSLDNQASITSTYNSDGYNTDVYVRVRYWTFSITIPKKSNEDKDTINRILTGVNSDGEPNIRWVITGTHQEGTVLPVYSEDGSVYYRYSYGEEKQWSGKIETFSLEYLGKSASVQDLTNAKTAQVVDNGTNFSITLTIAVENEYYYYDMVGTPNGGVANLYKPQKLEVTLMGDKTSITFEDVDVSSANITSAKNPVTIPHNELLQDSATWNGEKLSTIIKNNVLNDYSNGVPTGKIELFCGDLVGVNVYKDWKNGDILNINDVIVFADDKEKLLWKITGRTFTYNASPKLSLGLKNLTGVWGTVWKGSIECPFPSMSGSNSTDDGYYYGRQTTTINLSDYGITPSNTIKISGLGNYGGTIEKSYDYYVDGLELSSGFASSVQSNPDTYGVATAYYSKTTNTLEITMSGRNTKPNILLLSTLTFTLTKIEKYF